MLNISGRFNWLKDVHLPINEQLTRFIDERVGCNNPPCIIDGCNESITNYLNGLGFECVKIGEGAILNLATDHLEKKSLKELIRRGGRNKDFSELTFSNDNKDKLKSFIVESNHGEEP